MVEAVGRRGRRHHAESLRRHRRERLAKPLAVGLTHHPHEAHVAASALIRSNACSTSASSDGPIARMCTARPSRSGASKATNSKSILRAPERSAGGREGKRASASLIIRGSNRMPSGPGRGSQWSAKEVVRPAGQRATAGLRRSLERAGVPVKAAPSRWARMVGQCARGRDASAGCGRAGADERLTHHGECNDHPVSQHRGGTRRRRRSEPSSRYRRRRKASSSGSSTRPMSRSRTSCATRR